VSYIDLFVVLWVGPSALLWLYALGATVRMTRVIPVLAETGLGEARPSVSVVSPACNEATSIEGSVRSWLAQDRIDIQVIAVNDRSSDDTGQIIEELAAEDRRLVPVHVEALPDAWLGKLNALHHGVQRATGDWLLFADADVRLTEDAIARAVHHAETHGFDLVSAYPQVERADWLADLVWAAIGSTAGPSGLWRSRDPNSERAFAMGAFILVRRAAFEQTPGFPWLKLEVADDMGLAILLKEHGHRCDVVNGRGLVRLRWYTSFGDMVRRSQKNWFGIMSRFSLLRSCLIACVCFATLSIPLTLLLPLTHPLAFALPIVTMAALVSASALEARWSRRALLPALFAPFGFVLLGAMVLRAGVLGHRLGGIEWRGVVYPSGLLRGEQRFEM